MECTNTSLPEVGWLGWFFIFGVQGSIPANDVGYGQQWDVDQIFPTYLAYNLG